MTQKNTLSILVPTRERHDTLHHTLRTLVMQDTDRIEIIVSDNFSGPATYDVIHSFKDPRIKYVRPEQSLGMSENFEFALSHATGDWVTIVGDDDGMLPNGAKKFFNIIEDTKLRAVSSLTCSFDWPNLSDDNLGRLIILHGKGIKAKNARACLAEVLKGTSGFKSLPCLYTGGFMRMDLVNEIRSKSSGIFYHSKIPDIYAGIAICSTENEFLYSLEPLAVGGASSHSNGIQWEKASKEDVKKLKFCHEGEKPFHPSLGSGVVQSVPLFAYECYLQSQHLRDFEIDTTLTEQLALSIAQASKKNTDAVIEYCENICVMNNIDFTDVIRTQKKLRQQRKYYKILGKAKNLIAPSQKIQKHTISNDPSIETIYDASIRIAALLGEN